MIEVGTMIKTIRTQRGMMRIELANRIGVSVQSIMNYEDNKRRPDYDTLYKIAQELNVPISSLLVDNDGTNIQPIETQYTPIESLPTGVRRISDMIPHYIPLVGSVAAGTPLYMEENYGVYVDCPRNADFALEVAGDSMEPLYQNGDVVYIKRVPDVDDGKVCVVAIDDSCTLKRLYHIPGGIQLISENRRYAPMVFTEDNCDNMYVLGIVVGYTRMYRNN